VKRWIACAASSMSASRRSSAREERDSFSFNLCPHSRPERLPSHQIDASADQPRQFIGDACVFEQSNA
jgi:hypothetical protein